MYEQLFVHPTNVKTVSFYYLKTHLILVKGSICRQIDQIVARGVDLQPPRSLRALKCASNLQKWLYIFGTFMGSIIYGYYNSLEGARSGY